MCERLILENFDNRDIWATFTYTEEPETLEEAVRNMQNFIKRLNYKRKKMGLKNARYVYTTECGSKGRFHHHIVMDGDLDMDTVEATWNKGKRNHLRRLQKQREREDMQAQLEKQQATLEYVAAMADIDLPVEEATEGTDIDDEEEA